jgi:hypothetical protein
MKKNRTTKTNRNGLPVHTVHVKFIHQTATKVSIAGTFNDWRPAVTPMVPLGARRWFKGPALPPGVCEYLLVANGKWMTDPPGQETSPDPSGGLNLVLKVNG